MQPEYDTLVELQQLVDNFDCLLKLFIKHKFEKSDVSMFFSLFSVLDWGSDKNKMSHLTLRKCDFFFIVKIISRLVDHENHCCSWRCEKHFNVVVSVKMLKSSKHTYSFLLSLVRYCSDLRHFSYYTDPSCSSHVTIHIVYVLWLGL